MRALDSILDRLPIGIVAVDLGGVVVAANRTAGEILGMPPGEAVGQPLSRLFPPETQQLLEGVIARSNAGAAQPEAQTITWYPGAGQEQIIEVTAARVHTPTGATETVLLLQDITARVQADRERERLAEHLRLLLESTGEGIYGLDVAGRCTFINRAGAQMLGYEPEELLGRPMHSLIHYRRADGTPYPEEDCPIQRSIHHGQGFRLDDEVVWRRDGTPMPVVYSSFPIFEGDRVVGAVVTFSDITERKRYAQAQRFLSEAGAMLAASLDFETTLRRLARLSVPVLADVCLVDLLEASDRVRRMAIAHVDPAQERWMRELEGVYPLPAAAAWGVPKVVRTGQPELLTELTEPLAELFPLIGATGNPAYLALLEQMHPVSRMTVPLIARGRVIGAIMFIAAGSGRRYTASDLALAEELARRAALAIDNARLYREAQEALRLRDEFLTSVTHDLRTPLASIKGYAQLLQRRLARMQSPEVTSLKDVLRRIDATASKMNAQINELLDLARNLAGRPLELERQEVDLVPVVQTVVEDYRRSSARHHIDFEAAVPSLAGRWDAARLERVVANLLANAVKYSPAGGTISVRLSREQEGTRVWAVIEVRDQGLGIPAADLPYIFEQFYRAKNVPSQVSGSGIGLASVRQIVEQHGGTIAVRSEEGRGSTFTVRLPVEDGDATEGGRVDGSAPLSV